MNAAVVLGPHVPVPLTVASLVTFAVIDLPRGDRRLSHLSLITQASFRSSTMTAPLQIYLD